MDRDISVKEVTLDKLNALPVIKESRSQAAGPGRFTEYRRHSMVEKAAYAET